MRVAIPTFGVQASPRFCCAREALIVDVEDRRETARATVALGETCNPDRLHFLEGRGVSLLLCGGFDRQFLPEAERAGIHVFWGLMGPVEDVVQKLAAGHFTPPHRNPGCWCSSRFNRKREHAHAQ